MSYSGKQSNEVSRVPSGGVVEAEGLGLSMQVGNPSSLDLLEMAGHHQGGAVLTEATTSQYHSVPGLLPEGAHSLGELSHNCHNLLRSTFF